MFFPVSTAELRVFPVSTTELGDNKYIPHRTDTGAAQLVHKYLFMGKFVVNF